MGDRATCFCQIPEQSASTKLNLLMSDKLQFVVVPADADKLKFVGLPIITLLLRYNRPRGGLA